MKSASVILLFVVSLLGAGLALQAKDSYAPSPKFAFGATRFQRLAADAGSANVADETNEADVMGTPALPRLQPHALQVVGR